MMIFFLSCELENGEDPRASDQMKKSSETNEPKDSQKSQKICNRSLYHELWTAAEFTMNSMDAKRVT